MGLQFPALQSQRLNPLPAVLSPLAAATEALGLKQKQQGLRLGEQEIQLRRQDLEKGQLAADDEATLRALAQKHGGDPEAMFQDLKTINPRLAMIFGDEFAKRKAAADALQQQQATGMRNEAIKNAELLQGQIGPEFGTTGMAPTYQAPLPGDADQTPIAQTPEGSRTIGPQEFAPVQIPSAYGGASVSVTPQTRAGVAANAAEELRRKTAAKIEEDTAKQKAEKDYSTTIPPQPQAPRTVTTAEGVMQWNPANNTWVKIGDRPPSQASANEPLVPTTDEFGNTVYTPRSQAAGLKVPTSSQNKPPTSAERKTLGFFERVDNALGPINELESWVNGLNTAQQARLRLAPNIFQTSEGSRFTQAANDFINASLRRESGAAISDAEYKRFNEIYFPQPGDDKKLLAQKKKARDVQLETFKTESGKAFAEKYGDEQKATGAGKIRVKRKADGQTGTIDSKDFDASKYEKL